MKNKTALLIIFTLIFCLTCEQSFIQQDDPEDEGELTVDIIRITLSAKALGTIPGRHLNLAASIFPPFATRNEMIWESSNTSVAAVNSAGEITIIPTSVTLPLYSVITVSSVHDPSIYARCTVTVYPNYARSRAYTFDDNPVNPVKYPLDENNDIQLGNGVFILTGTGGASDYNSQGSGEHIIDPDNPYEYGIIPNGEPRALGTYTQSAANVTFDTGPSSGNHIRTSGNAARQIKIAAVFTPYEVIVNYMTNSGGSPRNVDIRIGDTEGIRVEGEMSSTTSPVDPKTVRYKDESPDGEGFVPEIYIECNQGVRIYEVFLKDLR